MNIKKLLIYSALIIIAVGYTLFIIEKNKTSKKPPISFRVMPQAISFSEIGSVTSGKVVMKKRIVQQEINPPLSTLDRISDWKEFSYKEKSIICFRTTLSLSNTESLMFSEETYAKLIKNGKEDYAKKCISMIEKTIASAIAEDLITEDYPVEWIFGAAAKQAGWLIPIPPPENSEEEDSMSKN